MKHIPTPRRRCPGCGRLIVVTPSLNLVSHYAMVAGEVVYGVRCVGDKAEENKRKEDE